MRRIALLLFALAGCGNWHQLRPTTANNVQVGAMTMYVVSAEYALRGNDRLKMVVVIDNRTNQPQQFDPHWVALRGASGNMFPPAAVHPPMPSYVPPFSRMQVSYMFYHVPESELSQLALMVADTATMQFAGYY